MIGTGLRTEWEGGYVRLDGLGTGMRMDEPGGNLRVDGLGDWQGAISGMIAGGELDRLMSAVFKLSDQLRGLIESRNAIYDGYIDAKNLYNDALAAAGGSIQDPDVLPALTSFTAAKQAVEAFARQVQTLLQLSKVFVSVAGALRVAHADGEADGIYQTTDQVTKFVNETTTKFSAVPEYNSMMSRIINAAVHEWQVWGIGAGDTSNPGWFQAFIKAAQMTCPMDGDVWPPETPSMAGLGELTTIALVIVWVVGIIATAVTVMYGISKLLDTLNSKAITAKQLILQRDKEKAEMLQKMRDAGASQDAINAAAKEHDAETKQQVNDIPESSLTGSLTTIALVGVAALVGLKVAKVI